MMLTIPLTILNLPFSSPAKALEAFVKNSRSTPNPETLAITIESYDPGDPNPLKTP